MAKRTRNKTKPSFADPGLPQSLSSAPSFAASTATPSMDSALSDMHGRRSDFEDDVEPAPDDDLGVGTVVPHHSPSPDGRLMPQGDVGEDGMPSDEGLRCWQGLQRERGISCFSRRGASCPSDCPIKREGAAGVAQLAGTTGSCLRFHDADQLPDTKSWLRGALSGESDLLTKLSETTQEVAKQVQQVAATVWLGGAPPNTGDIAREERQQITGSICIAVRYVRVLALADDIRSLSVGDGGRVFVADMLPQGLAYQRGVRTGDELVRVRINNGVSRIPDASPQWLRQLALDPNMAHEFCEAFFMGFAGHFPAEVSVSATIPSSISPNLSGHLSSFTGNTPFSVSDYAAFRPSSNSLVLASKAGQQEDHDDGPWQLMEVKRPQARRLLAAAVLSPTSAGKAA